MTDQKKVIYGTNPVELHKRMTESLWPVAKALSIAGHKVKMTADIESRTLDQNAAFHSMCGDIAKSGKKFAGKPRILEEWKALMVSGHSIATKEACDVVMGLEGEIVLLRESTAQMSKARKSSLIEYTMAWAVNNGISLNDGVAQ